jgi:hypothetical protein
MFMFTLYRQHLFEADGLFNVHRLYEVFPDAQITARFFPYFSRFYQRAPLLASFCLEYLLEPNAAVRTQNEDEILELALLMRTAIEDGARPASQTEDGSTPKPVTFRQDPGVAAAIASLKEARQSLSEGQTVAA